MTNNNHKNSDCGYAEQLVSYLYDEAGAAESAAFEAHLKSCAACADEMKAFSGVQFSISDWKANEFDALAAPIIEIPYERAEKTVEVAGIKESWLSGLRNLFSLNRTLSLATASLAVLAVCVGIVLFALNARKGNDLADSGNKKPVISPTVEKSPEQSNPTNVQNITPDLKPVIEQTKPQPEQAVQPTTKKTTVVKASQRETPKDAKKTVPKKDDVRRNKNNDLPPGVLGDEDEDDTLRLAEIFDEIDTDE